MINNHGKKEKIADFATIGVIELDGGCATTHVTPENAHIVFERQTFATYAFILVGPDISQKEEYSIYFGQFRRHAEFEKELALKNLLSFAYVRGQIWLDKTGIITNLHLSEDDRLQFFSKVDTRVIRGLVKTVLEKVSPSLLSAKLAVSLNDKLNYFYLKGGQQLKPVPNAKIGVKRKN